MKLLFAVFLAISYASATPTVRDITCPDVGLLCLDSNTYTYCINLGIMKIVGSTAYSCPAGFVCDHSTTTPCVPEQKVAEKVIAKSKQSERASVLNENLDDLLVQLAETTTDEPEAATTYAPATLRVPIGHKSKSGKSKGKANKH